jgi:chain length determinant protein EpsF
MPNKYTATAAVLVDTRGADALGAGTTDRSPNANQAIMATQTDLIGSGRVARKVVSLLHLENDPGLRRDWHDDTGGHGDAAAYIAGLLLKKLDVRPNRDSNVINLSFTSRDRKHATAVVNAFAQASIDTNLELKVKPARQFTGWFNERSKTLRRALEVAQDRLAAYQREKGLIGGGIGRIDIENAKLAQLETQLVQIQEARSESNSRQAQARGDARSSPDVLNNGVIASLRGAITTAEASLKQLSTQYGEGHPQVVAGREQLGALKSELEAEMQTVGRSLTTTNAVNEQREAAARAALQAQKARVLALLSGSNDAAVLQNDVDSAQRALEAATTRQSQTSLESQVQQTNVYMLTPAEEPGVPSSPRILLNGATAAVLGLLLGMALALWRETRAPLVRSAEDLSALIDLPLMASLPRAAPQRDPPGGGRRASRLLPS